MKKSIGPRPLAALTILALLLALSLLAGCQVKMVADFDPNLERESLALRNQVDTFLTDLEFEAPPACLYQKHRLFYEKEMPKKIRALVFRASLRTKNQTTMDLLEILRQNLAKMAKSHQAEGCMNPTVINSWRKIMDQSFRNLVGAEMDKK